MFQSVLANQLKQGKDMLMFGKKRDDNGEKVYRYSIRKYHFGAASVAIAALVFFANGVAKADMAVSPATANSTHQTVAGGGGDASGDSGSAGDPNAPATTTNSTSEVATPATAGTSTETTSVEKSVALDSSNHSENAESTTSNVSEKTEIPTVTTDKVQGDAISTEAQKVNVTDLKTALVELEGKIASITDEAKKTKLNAVIAEAQKVLADNNATQEQIDSQVTLVKDAVKSAQEVAEKVDEPKLSEENRSSTVEDSNRETAIPARSARGRRGRTTEVQPADSESTTPKEKLEKLSQSLNTYFKFASEITRPETKELIKGTEDIIRSVNEGLQQPNLTDEKIQSLIEQGRQAERKLALAVTRENSGKRDVLNWTRMAEGSDFRTNPTGLDTKRAYIVQNGDASGLPAETYLYAMRRGLGDKRAKASNLVSVREAYDEAKVSVEDKGNGNYRWTITFNSKYQGHKNAFYWFTLPKNHEITNILGITKTTSSGSSSSRGGFNFNEEWTTKIKELIGNDKKAVHGPASGGYDFNTAFRSLKDVTNSTLIPKLGGEERVENDDPVNSRNASGYYYLGPLANRFNGIDWGTEVPTAVRDKAARNMEGLHENTGRLYHFTHDAGKLTFTYETHTDYKYAPLYYAAGMRTIEDNSAKQYFMARGLQEEPTAPTVNTNNEGAVTVTPYSDSAQNKHVDKVELSYQNKNNEILFQLICDKIIQFFF